MKVFKYPLEVTDRQHITMPIGAEILSVQAQNGNLCLWAKVDPAAQSEVRTFHVSGTGHDLPNDAGKYVGTAQMLGGALVWHVFDAGSLHKQQTTEIEQPLGNNVGLYTYAAFIMEGIRDAHVDGKPAYNAAIDAWGDGCLEMIMEIVKYVDHIEHALQRQLKNGPKDFPGVFDYEVCNPFGQWVCEHLARTGRMPQHVDTLAKIESMVAEFFNRGDDNGREHPATQG